MAVVGFDDIPIARYIAPSLTTVRVDIAEIGRRAFAILFERLNASARGLPRRTECVTTTLVIRKSCGAAVRRPKISKGEK
jgi:LacI family transcriptional regulator